MSAFDFIVYILKEYGLVALLGFGLLYIIFIKPQNAFTISSNVY